MRHHRNKSEDDGDDADSVYPDSGEAEEVGPRPPSVTRQGGRLDEEELNDDERVEHVD
jgi:hypothetical protein